MGSVMCSLVAYPVLPPTTAAQRAYQQLMNPPRPPSVLYRQLLREFCDDNPFRAEFAGGLGGEVGGGAAPATPATAPPAAPKPVWPPAPDLILD